MQVNTLSPKPTKKITKTVKLLTKIIQLTLILQIKATGASGEKFTIPQSEEGMCYPQSTSTPIPEKVYGQATEIELWTESSESKTTLQYLLIS